MRSLLGLLAFLALSAAANTSHASFKFCGQWRYKFDDQGFGEDYLLHNLTATTGKINAARAYGVIEKDGVSIWQNFLDSSGCTATVPSVAGNYRFWMTSDF